MSFIGVEDFVAILMATSKRRSCGSERTMELLLRYCFIVTGVVLRAIDAIDAYQ
jgi:hypothetical protein